MFGTITASVDMLQFFHTIDTANGWFRGATLTDKILIFRLLSVSVEDMRKAEYSGGPSR